MNCCFCGSDSSFVLASFVLDHIMDRATSLASVPKTTTPSPDPDSDDGDDDGDDSSSFSRKVFVKWSGNCSMVSIILCEATSGR